MIILERDGSRLRHTPVVPTDNRIQLQNICGRCSGQRIAPPAWWQILFFSRAFCTKWKCL